ncbi:MAG: type III-B CRISPR module-associated protein Cmr5 [Candidatus Cloacimonetes bacterium]|nr:type III-B CRISPR module-associated protein Cmr5 [Candidatus Cloacimonadota bacterium]
MSQTLDQLRAKDAMEKVLALKNEDWASEYSSYVKRLGAALIMNGLGQALASELANGSERDCGGAAGAHNRLAANISTWLGRKDGTYPGKIDPKNLLSAMMKEDQCNYLVAQADLMKWLEWHKKFCVAFIPKSDKE